MISRSILCMSLFLAVNAVARAEGPKKPVVFVQTATPTELFESLTYPVRISSTLQSVVLADFDGTIESLNARMGQPARKGQPLGKIRNTDPVYEYAAVHFTSPISGRVASIDVTEGSRVTKGQKLLTLIDPNRQLISMEIPASDIASIATDMRGSLTLPGTEDAFDVQVRGVSPLLDPTTGTATVELGVLPGKSRGVTNLPIGSIGKAIFKAHAHQGLEVAESALVFKGAQPQLRIVANGSAKIVDVTLGRPHRGSVEVLKGLNSGDQVVVRASSYVAEGEAVTVQNLEVAKK